MVRIFGPVIAGAILQLAAVVLTTAVFYFLSRSGYLAPPWPFALCEGGTSCHAASLLVRWAYLLTAFGVALTNSRLTVRASQRFRKTIKYDNPEYSAKAVMVQLWIATIGSAVEELDAPAEFVVSLGQWIGGQWLSTILWPASWSVAIAAMGALTYAATKAVSGGIIED